MVTQSSILACRISWSLAGYSPWCCKELDMTERRSMHARRDDQMMERVGAGISKMVSDFKNAYLAPV